MGQLRFAVILAGCGNKDGAEIHESVLTLLAIDHSGGQYQCFAPDISQHHVTNFLTNEPMKETRNVLLESARIARSEIKPLSAFKDTDFDILIMPGGNGVAYNLCTFAVDGAKMTVNPDVERAVQSMRKANKPIGALCIAPVILAKLLKGVSLTFGNDVKVNAAARQWGALPQDISATNIVIDPKNKVVTTPCYMLKARVSQLAEGIEKLVQALIQMT